MADPRFQLVQLFGTNDLLTIVGVKSIETYQLNSLDDVNLLRQSYLRKVIRCHPFSSGVDLETQDGIKEAVTRGKKLFVMEEIYKFLTDNTNYDLIAKRKEYLSKGTIPDFLSLQYLRDNSFKGDERDYVIPEFEVACLELKSLYKEQMKKIKEIQQAAYLTEESTATSQSGDLS